MTEPQKPFIGEDGKASAVREMLSYGAIMAALLDLGVPVERARRMALLVVDPPGWQPIETAPKDGTLIDLWNDNGRGTDCKWGTYYRADATHPKPATFTGWVYYHEAWGEWVELNHEYPEKITHWMPIPPPP